MTVPSLFRTKPPETADNIIMRYVKGAGALGAAGTIAMHADVVVLAGLWTLMILALANHYKIKLSRRDALKIATALAAASTAFAIGFYAATAYFALSVIGIPAVMAANVAMDAILTCTAGVAVSMVFASGGGKEGLLKTILAVFGAFLSKLGWAFIKAWWEAGASVEALKELLGWRMGEVPSLPSH